MAPELCGKCAALLDPAWEPANLFSQCLGCGTTYHPRCWHAHYCTNADCMMRTDALDRSLPPVLPDVASLIVNYPIPDGPVNFLEDAPLGVSCGTVLDGREGPMWVRNNSAGPVAIPPNLWPPWATVRVRPEPDDLPTPEGWQVVPPGEERVLEVAFATVRPPSARYSLNLVPIRLPVGGGATGQVVRVDVISRPPEWGPTILGVGGLLFLLVVHLFVFLGAVWYPQRGAWNVSLAFALAFAWFAAFAPCVILVPVLWVAGSLTRFDDPRTGHLDFYRVVRWLVAPEDGTWLARRVGGVVIAFFLAWLAGWLVWAPAVWALGWAAQSTFPALLVSAVVIVLAVVFWDWLARVYGFFPLRQIGRTFAGLGKKSPAPAAAPPR